MNDELHHDQNPYRGDAPSRTRARRAPLWVGFVILFGVAITMLELFVLVGEEVFDQRVDANYDVRVEIPIDRVDEPHLLRIYGNRKAKLSLQLTAPSGEVVATMDEWDYHRQHFASWTPAVAGTYVLEGTWLKRSSFSSPTVQVFVNDRRWFFPLLYRLGL